MSGNGSNRLSEITGRLNKPATQLSQPIDNLIQLEYVRREVPFGESEKSGKKSLCRIFDPFMNFYFTFVVPNLSRLEMGLTNQVYNSFENRIMNFVASEWESLCRRCIPMKPINGIDFDIAFRWWGNNLIGEPMKIDIVAEALDKKYLLVGKWSHIADTQSLIQKIEQKTKLLPFAKEKQIIPLLCLKEISNKKMTPNIFLPKEVLNRLK